MRSEQQTVPASAAPIGRAKLQRAAKQTAAERIRKHAQGGGPIVIANNVHLAQQTAGQCVSDAQQPSREMQDLRTLLSEYRDKVAALEDAALEHSAAKDELEAKLRDVQEKQQALVAKAIQKAQKEGQRGSEKLQKRLEEQAARADALELALVEAQASSAAVGALSDDTLLVHALDLMKKSPAHRQRLLDIGQLLCKD
ncbi:hypothetical protein COCSUDRAFT_55357 [Coccomyxa subellipsoidea C-169]|uniref:Uncharacterized protein n=1 Tax=Coccomyxa subellipsoidea (strain C-169) TaxID=574566 RepID=I0Z9M3_COCSC|nr:hypothetical protein COCSUDRAFT_55357 [Coccomyxa subellipsoidea C-169]EIE27342.1 hypothetical protein COCSUDRAFT_55357 [Coccomyxa subellipsoidea C-169]|eukprot:XP_005651886.1 hypothetical protein COCSUDRAFT_55357 [Coccomyxa subellipsoidea C-169]